MSAVTPGQRTIVVVEDDPEIRELEVFLLGAEGYRVVGLPDGERVVEAVQKNAADLVLLDLMLPKRSGNVVLQDLSRDETARNVPVIVVSAYTRQLSRTPQVQRVLNKPFDVTDLLDAVHEALTH
ncbi:MAG: response regulator [Sandaracinaceae bacterium]|nr:response regulator [Sandaracinaceae bacterium]